MLGPLRAQHRPGLHELNVAVGDHVEAIAPRIADVVAPDAGTALTGGRDHRGHVVDDETEVPLLAPRLHLVLEESDELIAEVDGGHSPRPAAQLQIREERSPELERLV